jgi:glycine/D-amino acid oxidase-like deaminating enzyme
VRAETREHLFDVAVIGAGVVGCAVARDIGRRGMSCVLVDRADDVGDATSKANTAISILASTPNPARSNRGLLRGATSCSPTMPARPVSRSSASEPSFSHGMTISERHCQAFVKRRCPTGTAL